MKKTDVTVQVPVHVSPTFVSDIGTLLNIINEVK
jgi:hypothetical protein